MALKQTTKQQDAVGHKEYYPTKEQISQEGVTKKWYSQDVAVEQSLKSTRVPVPPHPKVREQEKQTTGQGQKNKLPSFFTGSQPPHDPVTQEAQVIEIDAGI